MKSFNAIADINVLRILRKIWQNKGISRTQIATELGLDKSTITKIVSSLLDIGLIKEICFGDIGPNGGRRPVFLEINALFALIGGVEINPDSITCVLSNFHGEIIYSYTQSRISNDFEDDCLLALHILLDESYLLSIPLASIGFGLPAIIRHEDGKIMFSIPLNINCPTSFSQKLSQKINIPIFIENDARCCCYGELAANYFNSNENALFVLTEVRTIKNNENKEIFKICVGMGIIINGQIYRGNNFAAGEFRSIIKTANDRTQLKAEDLHFQFENREEDYHIAFTEIAQHVAFLVNILDLDVVYLGEIQNSLLSALSSSIMECLTRQKPYDTNVKCHIKLASYEKFAVAFGAAGMCLDLFFSLPNLYAPSTHEPSVIEKLVDFNLRRK